MKLRTLKLKSTGQVVVDAEMEQREGTEKYVGVFIPTPRRGNKIQNHLQFVRESRLERKGND